MLIPVDIASFAVQAVTNMPLVILKEHRGMRTIAIPIDPFEASAIAIQSLNVASEKPLTIDLVKMILDTFQGKIDKMVINGPLGDPQAFLYIIAGARMRAIECRCGDGIALSMRCGIRIFVNEKMFTKYSAISVLDEAEQLRASVSDIDTVEFGKYYL